MERTERLAELAEELARLLSIQYNTGSMIRKKITAMSLIGLTPEERDTILKVHSKWGKGEKMLELIDKLPATHPEEAVHWMPAEIYLNIPQEPYRKNTLAKPKRSSRY